MNAWTEEEARTNWCPMSRPVIDQSGNIYTNMPNSEANTCAASLCMAWRWIEAPHHMQQDQTAKGYCGLAGQP